VSTAGLAKNCSSIIDANRATLFDNDSGSESLDTDNRKKIKLSTNDSNHQRDTLINRYLYPFDIQLLEQLIETRSFLIDVDLSFFSTDDHIRKQFDENEYEILRYVYTRIVHDTNDNEIQRYTIARENALEQIRALMDEYLTVMNIEQTIVIE
jgi:hypothetical protein